jgi:hypothetical protein
MFNRLLYQRWRRLALARAGLEAESAQEKQPVMICERLILAQLVKVDGDWLEFALMSCETKNGETWWKNIPELKANKHLRRSCQTLVTRKPAVGHSRRRTGAGRDGQQISQPNP